jgi:LysM repeat protein
MRTYTVMPGDTLGKIAGHFYSDVRLHEKLAAFNGITDPDRIYPGQIIELPAKSVLTGKPARPPVVYAGLQPPRGLEQIKAVFGNNFEYIDDDGTLRPEWESTYFTRARLPFEIPLSWDQTRVVRNLYCHKKLAEIFSMVFDDIERKGLQEKIKTYGGCFNYRTKRGSGKISTHSWAIAIDLNPGSNRPGSKGDMDEGIVEIFRNYGFTWGGNWPGRSKDPMHFQFCSGY